MKVLARIGIIVLVTVPGITWAAQSAQPEYAKIEHQLQRQARELRNVAKSMQAHARKPLPAGFDSAQKASIAAKRRDLEAAAADALELAKQVEDRANKARRKVLSRADMASLGAETNTIESRIKAKRPGTLTPKPTYAKPPKSQDDEVRNKRSEFQTMFENFDQKANQLFNILSTVMKQMKEMQSSVTRNVN
jgi:coenzyme F420-reducing hydrogenase alpha subunit